MRMIHALPMRALTNQLEQRMGEYSLRTSLRIRVAAQHGKRPESVLFYADAIFATLDQVVSAYACAPLSLSVRQGNIPAGAIPGSFMVFDEVHTFEPQLGLQCVLLLTERAKALGVPFVLMSATLPTSLVEALQKRFGTELIEVNEENIPRRGQRRVTVHIGEDLAPETVLELASQDQKKTLVVVNTVDGAIDLYAAVRKHWDGPIILAHSRFYDDDRLKKEQQIEALFGRNAPPGRALLIATQVVEVGLDISADLLLTELAPMDALVQRAGRCARWGGRGDAWVFTELRTKKPYDDKFVAASEKALKEERADGKVLTWQWEKNLVDKADEICGRPLEQFIEPQAAGEVLMTLAEAAFAGDPTKAARAVREGFTVETALHDQPKSLGWDVFRLPRVRLHPSVFAGFVKEKQPRVWQATVKRDVTDDYHGENCVKESRPGDKLGAAAVYIIDPAYASYHEEYGLRLGLPGEPAVPDQAKEGIKPHANPEGQPEPWQKHVANVVECFEKYVRPKEGRALVNLAKWLDKSEQDLLRVVKLVLIFHDVGKLTVAWQKKIRHELKPALARGYFLAHRGGEKIRGLPPHATVSAWVATPCLRRVAQPECTLAVPALTAIAHHHSVGADSTPPFQMEDGWFELVEDCCWKYARVKVSREDFNTKARGRAAWCGVGFDFLRPKAYTSYILLSRWLRLADRIASGDGEDAILRYEEWFRDI